MKYTDFRKRITKFYPVFTRDDIRIITDNSVFDNQISQWIDKGYLIKLKNGVYCLKENIPHNFLIAKKLYEPSYISLDRALFEYGLIPDVIASVTSVTTKPTRRIKTQGTLFVYRKIKRLAFCGYQVQNKNGFEFYMAKPGKALVDYFYLNQGQFKKEADFASLRLDLHKFQKLTNWSKIFFWAGFFESDVLKKNLNDLKNYVKISSD